MIYIFIFFFQSVNSNNVDSAPSLIDMGPQQKTGDSSFADFSGYQCANANGSFDEFNPRAATTPQCKWKLITLWIFQVDWSPAT